MASRLAQMQARFQQRQMQEKEEKLLKLYETQQQRAFERVNRNSPGSMTQLPPGKVRQMFDERRQKAGIDKSYPLEPIKTRKPEVKKPTRSSKSLDDNYKEVEALMNKHNLSSGRIEDEEMPEAMQEVELFNGKLANVGGRLPSEMKKPVTKSLGTTTRKQQTQPQQQQQQQTVKAVNKIHVTSGNLDRRGSGNGGESAKVPNKMSSPSKAPNNKYMAGDRAASGNNRTNRQPQQQSPAVARDDLVACKYCQRRFATDRIAYHEEICARAGKKKRKTYDAAKHRMGGTEMEQFCKKTKSGSKGAPGKPGQSKSNWRQKHEEFIAAIRSAKQAQEHLAKGGNLKDLPPPPPSSNPDYITCPHCGRRFNESAAARHIPKCATYEFNKPKAAPKLSKQR